MQQHAWARNATVRARPSELHGLRRALGDCIGPSLGTLSSDRRSNSVSFNNTPDLLTLMSATARMR
jgi:hypothetical protein